MSYSGNTLAFQAKARGSIPLIRFSSYTKGLEFERSGQNPEYFYILPRFAQNALLDTFFMEVFLSCNFSPNLLSINFSNSRMADIIL